MGGLDQLDPLRNADPARHMVGLVSDDVTAEWKRLKAAGVEFILQKTKDQGRTTKVGARRSFFLRPRSFVVPAMLVVATLAWGYTRLHVSSKRQLWLFRRFGEATLERLPPGAAVITHWEQGMTLQYLIFVEGRRPDVWVDVVEPSDDDWGARARRRYADRAVFFVGAPSDVAGLPVELVREDDYADVFELAATPAANTLSRPAHGRRWGHRGE